MTLASTLLCLVAMAEQIQLRFVVWDGEEAMVAIRRAAEQFESRYPNIKVKLETVNANYQEKLLAQYAAKVAPDVAMMDPGNFQKYAKRGALLPLNQFFDTPGFDISTYYKEIVDPHSYRGIVYVLPRDIAPCGVVYFNKRLFQEAGIPLPKNTLNADGTWNPKANWTWDFFGPRPELREKDFIWVMQQLTKKDPKTGRTTQWGYLPAWSGLLVDMFSYSVGGKYVDDYEEPKKVLLGDTRVVQAHQYTADLSFKYGFMPSSVELSSVLQTNARQLFTQQKVAMFQSGIWEVPGLRKDLWDSKTGKMGFEWDIAMAPAYKDGTLRFPTGGSGYCILSQTKHPKEAWLLTQWMAGAPGMTAMAQEGLAQPAITSLAQQQPWIPDASTTGAMRYPENRIITHLGVPFVQFGPTSMYWSDVSGVMYQNHGKIWDGTSDAKTEIPISVARGQARLDVLQRNQKLGDFSWLSGAGVGVVMLATLFLWVYGPEFKKRRSSREKRENRIAYLFVGPWILGLLLFTAGPMILSLLMSFSDWDIIQPAKWRGIQNFSEAFTTEARFWKSIQVTTIYTVVSVPLGLAMALALALLLNVKVRGIPIYRTLYYLPSLSSAVAASLIWRTIFRADGGLLNLLIYGADGKGNFLGLATLLHPVATANGQVNWLGNESTALPSLILMSIWGAGGGMVILLAALQGVPQFYYEAATVDGASPWRQFRNITLPMISPAIFFSLLTGFIGSFQSFSQAFLMTQGGPNDATMLYILNLYNQAFLNLRMGYASALAWILFVIILIVTLFQLKMSKWVYYEGGK